jgi:hypothetical protein
MMKKILKRTWFATCLMAIAMVCIGSVSAAPVPDIRDDNIVVDVRIGKVVYLLGEPVNVNIAITNNGPNTTLLFPTSQLADFNITELLNDAWNLVDDDRNPVTPGNYYIDGWMVKELCDSRPEINGERLEIAIYSGPRNLKRDAIYGLEAIDPVQKDVRHLIDASIGFITESLRDDLWMNDTHLNPNETPVGAVFDAEMSAVILLDGVQRWDPTIEDAVNDAINKLTRADELIVLAVINDSDSDPMAKEYPGQSP